IRVLFTCIEFFFSSRRRHTRFSRDWSSDVCSSDLSFASFKNVLPEHVEHGQPQTIETVNIAPSEKNFSTTIDERKECELDYDDRSEERRVGKECRARGCA